MLTVVHDRHTVVDEYPSHRVFNKLQSCVSTGLQRFSRTETYCRIDGAVCEPGIVVVLQKRRNRRSTVATVVSVAVCVLGICERRGERRQIAERAAEAGRRGVEVRVVQHRGQIL